MFFSEFSGVIQPNTEVGEVAVFTAQSVGKNDTCAGSVDVLDLCIVTSMLDGSSRDRDRPELTRIDLWQRSRRLSPSSPIELCIGDQSANFRIRIPLSMVSWATVLPEMVNRSGPPSLRQRPNADLGFENVLPESVNILGIGHQRPQTDDGDGLKRALFDALAGFSILCGQRHGLTS